MITLHIKVKPGSSKDEITLDETGNLLIKIKERPIDGAANTYLIKFISREFNIHKRAITIEKGNTSRFKKISLNMDAAILQNLIGHYKK